MSDTPPPPTPQPTPVPPPAPAPSFAPPPGYTAYAPTNWQVGMRRVRGLGTAILILLAVFAIGQIVSIATTSQVGDAAVEYLETGDEDEFNEDIALNGIGSLLAGAATIAIVVLTMIWLFRIVSNHRALGRQVSWAPGWAIGGWFLPPLLYIIPMLVLRESWKASAAQVPPSSEDWRREGENPLIWLWLLLYSVVPIVLGALGAAQVWNFARDTEDLAEYFDEQQGIIVAQGVVGLASAVVWALLVRALTDRHMRLTGETSAR